MPEPTTRQLRPAYQIGILLVVIVILRLYYAWIESRTQLHYPIFADDPAMLCAIYLGLVPVIALLSALAAWRYFSPALTVPFAAAGGGAAGLIVNSFPGAIIGAGVGLLVYSKRLRQAVWNSARILLRFAVPTLLWSTWLGSLLTCLFVQNSPYRVAFQIGLSLVFVIGVCFLLRNAFRRYRGKRLHVAQAVLYCAVASLIGLVLGPLGNTLYRVYAIDQVGTVGWNSMPRFELLGQGLWEFHGVVLHEDATDRHLEILGSMPSLTWLSIEGSDISDDMLATTLQKLNRLELFELKDVAIGDEGVKTLNAPNLYQARFINTSISDKTFANLATIPTLQVVQADGVTRQGNGLSELARGGRIHYLSIRDMPLTDKDLADLTPLTGLKSLNLSGTQITGSGLKSLKQNTWLTTLRIADSPLEDRFLADIDPGALNWLTLDGIPLTEQGAQAIGSMTRLLGLSLTSTNLTDDHLEHLSKMSPPSQVTLDGRQLSESAGDLIVGEDVEIHIEETDIGVEDIERLIAIGHDVTLNDCRIDEEAMERLTNHSAEPSFILRMRDPDQETIIRLRHSSVAVFRIWE